MPIRLFTALLAICLVAPLHADVKSLAVKPKDAFAVVAELKKVSGADVAPTTSEMQLFADAQDGRLDKFTVAEAALLASGVTDAAKRKAYLAKLDEIEAGAKKALKGTKSPRERGEALLKFLHAGPMSAGYESHKTTLADVLDSRQFNCVSSALMYNLMAERLGLETQAAEGPGVGLSGHVYSVLRTNGKLINVETTNKLGFNPMDKPERPDGVAFDPEKDSDRLIDTVQLAAVIYYNRGVTLGTDGHPHEAIDMFYRALSLDPTNASAAKNIVAEFANWGPKLAMENRFEDGLHVLSVGLRIAPDESGIIDNQRVVWTDYARARMAAGKVDEALAIARRAIAATDSKDSDLTELPARLFLRPGEKLVEQRQWAEAIALADRAVPKLDGDSLKKLRDWRGGLYIRWSDERRTAGDWDGAFTALEKGAADDPQNDDFPEQIAFSAQEWLAHTAKNAPAKLGEVVAALRKRFPNNERVQEVIASHVHRGVDHFIEAGEYEHALKELDERKSWLNDEQRKKTGIYVYVKWGQSLKSNDWKKALEVLTDGMKEYPDGDLQELAESVCDGKGFPLIKEKKYKEAIGFYEEGLKLFPKSTFLEDRVKLCKDK